MMEVKSHVEIAYKCLIVSFVIFIYTSVIEYVTRKILIFVSLFVEAGVESWIEEFGNTHGHQHPLGNTITNY